MSQQLFIFWIVEIGLSGCPATVFYPTMVQNGISRKVSLQNINTTYITTDKMSAHFWLTDADYNGAVTRSISYVFFVVFLVFLLLHHPIWQELLAFGVIVVIQKLTASTNERRSKSAHKHDQQFAWTSPFNVKIMAVLQKKMSGYVVSRRWMSEVGWVCWGAKFTGQRVTLSINTFLSGHP